MTHQPKQVCSRNPWEVSEVLCVSRLRNYSLTRNLKPTGEESSNSSSAMLDVIQLQKEFVGMVVRAITDLPRADVETLQGWRVHRRL